MERRRVPLAELETERGGDVARVVELFTDQRLLTVTAGNVEVAHEALLREWPRLRGWIEQDREGLRIHRGVTAAAQEWRRLDRDEGALFRGSRLTEALEWRDTHDVTLNELEREFLDASHARRRSERRLPPPLDPDRVRRPGSSRSRRSPRWRSSRSTRGARPSASATSPRRASWRPGRPSFLDADPGLEPRPGAAGARPAGHRAGGERAPAGDARVAGAVGLARAR